MDVDHVNPYDTGTATPFPDMAKIAVVEYYNTREMHIKGWVEKELTVGDVYVVWFAKTLQNWKALVSTTVEDGRYYEITYNGEKDETYLDVYVKADNIKIDGAVTN
jgi:uncharacterized protein DUF6275